MVQEWGPELLIHLPNLAILGFMQHCERRTLFNPRTRNAALQWLKMSNRNAFLSE